MAVGIIIIKWAYNIYWIEGMQTANTIPNNVRVGVLRLVKIKTVFLDVMPCRLVDMYQSLAENDVSVFKEDCGLNFKG
jgi:hypothetical protein